MTNAAAAALEEARVESILLLHRHIHGDWGDLYAHDTMQNNLAILLGQRLLSAYDLPSGKTIWILTTADRTSTTLLLKDPSGLAT
ncbi:hypothetical protein G5S34_08565 [Herbaspirillum frisingense]|uniref:hypothetical protein n=1 Tax=Herbaspirillum frisingense TaxID=92645 RepID=UPI0015FFED5A|nr:hypothetical protein [Herbaspirillum frisingense]QNB06816.1 hypothetical protein G5S34_08565 [Herbaspirillum frisingense]